MTASNLCPLMDTLDPTVVKDMKAVGARHQSAMVTARRVASATCLCPVADSSGYRFMKSGQGVTDSRSANFGVGPRAERRDLQADWLAKTA